MKETLQLLDEKSLNFRLDRILAGMSGDGASSLLISSNTNKFYFTGRIFDGWILISAATRSVHYFVRRQSELSGPNVHKVRKPEDIAGLLAQEGIDLGDCVALELDETPYSMVTRLCKALSVSNIGNANKILMAARSVKAEDEVDKIKACAVKHDRIYRRIPHLYREGMSDIELQIEIERETRLEGALGIMRVTGSDMEINMGSVLVGENADTPSPYDFALGGAGASPALPIGADGTIIRRDRAVMVDTNGDFNGYMTDMTRTFIVDDQISDEARRAHQLSVAICRRMEAEARPGVPCADLYNIAVKMATEAGLADKFMGSTRQAGFIGHGVGITINELPVLAPRSKSVLEENNIIAIEPKFVIEHVGAVGIENTYRVTANGLECLTNTPEDLISLED